MTIDGYCNVVLEECGQDALIVNNPLRETLDTPQQRTRSLIQMFIRKLVWKFNLHLLSFSHAVNCKPSLSENSAYDHLVQWS